MNFMAWLSSLDELLYEVMSWIIFLPVTLWRTIVRPLDMMAYADAQLALPEDAQYQEALSPPLFLALCLLLAHGLELAMGDSNAIVASRHGLAALVNDNSSLLLLRLILFATFPLAMALRQVRIRGLPLNRQTLRQPFYAQCYPAAAFALTLSIGVNIGHAHAPWWQGVGVTLSLTALLAYVMVEIRWFARQRQSGMVTAAATTFLGLAQSMAVVLPVGYVFTR